MASFSTIVDSKKFYNLSRARKYLIEMGTEEASALEYRR